jgi:uncharacterized membrane protein YcaP (DUF421 family)
MAMTDLLAHPTFRDMFILGVPILEKVLRPWLVYIFLVIGLRLAGKRELAQINTFDLIVLLTLSNTVQNAIIGNDTSVTGGVIGAISLLAINYLVIRFLLRRAKLDRFLQGKAVVLIEEGQLREKNMEHELITRSELEGAAHKQGFRDFANIARATLETGGSITFVAKDPAPIQTHYDDLVRRLEAISRQLQTLQSGS